MTMFVGNNQSFWSTWKTDFAASIVVFLVALPLCLGIALASGAPLISGLIAGIVGGIVVGILSRSPLSVSGPAAGLTVIVYSAIQTLPSYEAFLLSVVIAGAFQVVFGVIKAGIIGDFIPISVIKGMLAAIGLLIIIKQIPYALGYSGGHMEILGLESLQKIIAAFSRHIEPGAVFIFAVSLAFLFVWDKFKPEKGFLKFVPGPLVVVLFGSICNIVFLNTLPAWHLSQEYLVNVPVSESLAGFTDFIAVPDFGFINNMDVWTIGLTLALVASVETLLNVKAIDKLDPQRRITPNNRELMAQGAGNIVSGMIGGIPLTSVIVRGSANVSAGGRNKLSTIFHGILLLLAILFFAQYINIIPLSALAAVLISVGYKLTKPAIFIEKWKMGSPNLVPFVITIVAILATDLLVGVCIGIIVGLCFVIYRNFQSAISFVEDGDNYLIRCKKDIFFIHKYELRKNLRKIPRKSSVIIDVSHIKFMDMDNVEIINDFITNASYRDIKVIIKKDISGKISNLLEVPNYETV